MNSGEQILLLLRHQHDKDQFLSKEFVIDTLLHELCHNRFGAHDESFHALWDELRDEYQMLKLRGWTGQSFLSEGRSLGGRTNARVEATRFNQAARAKQVPKLVGTAQKLGGQKLQKGADVRNAILAAIERRTKINEGCANTHRTAKENIAITRDAELHGFKSKADLDAANERAIEQATWDLIQQEQREIYGSDYVSPSPENPAGSRGLNMRTAGNENPFHDLIPKRPLESNNPFRDAMLSSSSKSSSSSTSKSRHAQSKNRPNMPPAQSSSVSQPPRSPSSVRLPQSIGFSNLAAVRPSRPGNDRPVSRLVLEAEATAREASASTSDALSASAKLPYRNEPGSANSKPKASGSSWSWDTIPNSPRRSASPSRQPSAKSNTPPAASRPARLLRPGNDRPISRLVTGHDTSIYSEPDPEREIIDLTSPSPPSSPDTMAWIPDSPPPKPKPKQPERLADGWSASGVAVVPAGKWACETCTLHNPNISNACDACGSARKTPSITPSGTRSRAPAPASRASAAVAAGADAGVGGTSVFGRAGGGARQVQAARTKAQGNGGFSVFTKTWKCSCGKVMEAEWWTCSACGNMKTSS
jgi:hypothetical protein